MGPGVFRRGKSPRLRCTDGDQVPGGFEVFALQTKGYLQPTQTPRVRSLKNAICIAFLLFQ